MTIRGLKWGMTPTEAIAQFEGPQLEGKLGSGNLTASLVPLGPFSASILLGFFAEGLRNIRLILDQSSFGSNSLPEALDLIAKALSEKYGAPIVDVQLNAGGAGSSTAALLNSIRSRLSNQENGSITWRWETIDTSISLQFLAMWGWKAHMESVTLLYENSLSKPRQEGATALKAQLGAGLL